MVDLIFLNFSMVKFLETLPIVSYVKKNKFRKRLHYFYFTVTSLSKVLLLHWIEECIAIGLFELFLNVFTELAENHKNNII